MTVAFLPAYGVTVQDAADVRPLASISFDPIPPTRDKLADLGLLLKPRAGGFQLFGQFLGGATGQRRAPLTGEVVLIFRMSTTDANFARRFLPDLTVATGPGYYLTNRTSTTAARAQGSLTIGAEVAAADATRVVGRQFLAPAALSANPVPTAVALATYFAPKRTLADVPITATLGETQVAVDLRAAPERAFTIAQKPPGTAKTRVFVDDDLAARPGIGVLELVLRPIAGPDPPGGRQFTASFRRRP